jgi:hypothetical protein
VNEIELIRAQLAAERVHVQAVAQACAAAGAKARAPPNAAALAELQAAGADYLRCVLGWFEARDQRLIELNRTRPGLDEHARQAIPAALAQPGSSREALQKLEAISAGTPLAWQALAEFVAGVWSPRRDAIDALLTAITRPADWRTIAALEADSILDERRRFERARAACPPDAPLAVSC